MEDRLKLLSDYISLANDLGAFFIDVGQKSSDEPKQNRYTYIAYSLISVSPMADLVILGVSKKNNILIFSGLRMLEENLANMDYIFKDDAKIDVHISRMLKRGIEYQQAFTEIRNNPELGMKHLSSVKRWSKSTITGRVHSLGEGPEFRYAMACKYLHSDIWTVLNNNAIKDFEGLMYGQISWAIEDIQATIRVIHLSESLNEGFDTRYTELVKRTEEDFKNEPAQTYY